MASEAEKLGIGTDLFSYLERDYQDWIKRFIGDLNLSRRRKVLDFIQELELSGSTENTVKRYVRAISTLGSDGKPYEELTREDLIDWIHGLPDCRKEGNGKLSDETVNLMKRLGKRFLRYCHTGEMHAGEIDERPKVLGCIQYRDPKGRLPKDILTKEEVRMIVEACRNQRNRAMILVLYESGCRVGEFLSLRIGDVEPDRHGASIIVDGKTGERRIRLVESVPELQLWLNMHPHKGDREAPLWLSREGEKKAVTGKRVWEIINRGAREAGIEKNVNPHLFRHSRATHLACVLTEAQMREFFGWSENSDVPSRYVHLSGRDIDDTLLDHYGVEEKEEEMKDESLRPRECPRCEFENPVGSQFCSRCGMALDDEAAQQVDKKRERADQIQRMFNEWVLEHGENLFREFINRPEVKEKMAKIWD